MSSSVSDLGAPMSKTYAHVIQPLPGDMSNPGNRTTDGDRAPSMPTGYNPATAMPSSSQNASSQFVPNIAGVGQRSVPKRSTFKRTNRVDTSTDDLLHDSQQQAHSQPHPSSNDQYQGQAQYDYNNPPSSSLHAPQHVRHPSGLRPSTPSFVPGATSNTMNIRPPLIHGAHDSRNSSGHDSGLSSGGASFDPEQYHQTRNLGNQTHPSVPATSMADPYDVPAPIPIPRRKSLPSIVKTTPDDYKVDETARSSDHLPGNETFIIENGIRKRVTEQAPSYTESGTVLPQTTVMTSSTGSPTLARRIILESVQRVNQLPSGLTHTGGTKRVSMPTLDNVARQRQAAPSMY